MKRKTLALLACGALLAGSAVTVPARAMTHTQAGMTVLHVTLRQQAFSGVTGSATASYNAATKMTTVTVTVNHLEPGSSHPEHIHAGVCTSNGPVLWPLKTIKANAKGTGMETTVVKGSVMNKADYINVHVGPGLALTQYTVLACGELHKGM
jgi:CHRD domain